MGSLAATSTPPLSFSRPHVASSAGLFDRSRGARGFSPARLRTVGAVAYMERNPNSMSAFASKVIGSLPVVGLLARIFNEEGGVGDDLIDFAEFRRRVGKKCSITDSRAFIEFKDRRGVTGDPFYVLLCCWLAAIGAGLLKSEEIFEGVARLRISKDIEFEELTFLSTMKAAREDRQTRITIGRGRLQNGLYLLDVSPTALSSKRAKLKASSPKIPIEVRVEKAFEAIYVCCFGKDPIEEEDKRLLCIMLNAVFPSVERSAIGRIVESVAAGIAEGKRANFSEMKPLPEEAVQRQMKDLELLRQRTELSS
ncbi:hypothetical protein KSP39_PZI019482 [Platanthera zijinensis]|uniref:Photosystem I assembly factor PSA3, chloroplastic n=1 Tax=Platanthera zijinensis TaxID=2320716 RepID=A0AAP0FYA4_9ASPA